MQRISIDEIKVQPKFSSTICSPKKVDIVKQFIEKTGDIDKPIVLNGKDYIIDGYSRYLAAQQMGVKNVPCVRQVKLVHCKFDNCDKVYTWRNDQNLTLKKGDRIMVDSSGAEAIVTVVGFSKGCNYKSRRHKQVLGFPQ